MPAPSLLQKVQQAMSEQQYSLAEQYLTQALAKRPEDPETRLHYSLLLIQTNRLNLALVQLEILAMNYPDAPAVVVNRGEVLRRLGRFDEAVEVLESLLRKAPQLVIARFNLALSLRGTGQITFAVEQFQRALQQKPDQGDAWYNLGNCLSDQGRWTEAADSYLKALPLVSGELKVRALNNLGAAYIACRQADRAVDVLQQALLLQPDFSDARVNLARAEELLGELEQAKKNFRRASAQQPEFWWHALHADGLCPAVFDSNPAIDQWRQTFSSAIDYWAHQDGQLPDSILHLSGAEPPAGLLYQGRDNRAIKTSYAAMLAPKLSPVEPNERRSGAYRVRIGLVVSEGHEAIFARSFAGILRRLDDRQFELVIAVSRTVLARTKALLNGVNAQWIALDDRVDKAAQQLRSLQLDVLYHWEVGSDSFNYFLPWFNPAAVQCTGWGWSDTTGIPAMDFFLSSDLIDSANAQAQYSETLLCMKQNLFTWAEPPQLPERPLERSDFGFSDREHLYLCHQNPRKIHPDFDQLAADILRHDAAARLLLIADHSLTAVTLQHRLGKRLGPLAERVSVQPKMTIERYLSLLNCVDVALDPPHYSGANTSFDALGLGVPVVTMPSQRMRANYTAGLYQQMGLGDLTAVSAEHYVKLALSLGGDAECNAYARQQIVARGGRIFYDRQAVTELESVWCQMAGF